MSTSLEIFTLIRLYDRYESTYQNSTGSYIAVRIFLQYHFLVHTTLYTYDFEISDSHDKISNLVQPNIDQPCHQLGGYQYHQSAFIFQNIPGSKRCSGAQSG